MNEKSLVPEALQAIDPSALDYTEWLEVGMALHAEGYTCDMWDGWSKADPRYKPGECWRKWAGFGQGSATVAGGTIVKLARDRFGYDGGRTDSVEDVALDWDAPIVDPAWVEPAEVEPPSSWDPVAQAVEYLDALFDSDDIVGYVTSAFERDGRWTPKGKGDYTRTAGELIDLLTRKGSIEDALGTPNEEAGAWIRFNPLTGAGVRNCDVADFRYALVESDDMPIEAQAAMIAELQLPCAAIVHSGGKSLHAIVKVDAKDASQYRERVETLYRELKRNGFVPDEQNKNPSRLSRFPGFMRSGRQQYIVSKACGKESWAAWREWVDEQSDDLPDAETLSDVWGDMPELAPALIDGVLRQGHKMLLAGPSKAGKSFALIELCVAIAEGRDWIGFTCAKGKVLYVNLELDRASCLHRFRDVYSALGIEPENAGNIEIWNLRGRSKPMDKLAPSLIRRALKTRPIAVVIDPIYKVLTGDENSADQMAAFCNQFDKIAAEVGCAVVYCHHHSKGAQGGKRSMDRASGSGVFARDPDAQLDMIQLPISDDLKKIRDSDAACEACEKWLDEHDPTWRDRIDEDDRRPWDAFRVKATTGLAKSDEMDLLNAVCTGRHAAATETAFRIEGILREYPAFSPVNLWFRYPLHKPDKTGVLGDIEPEETKAPWQRGTKRNVENKPKRKDKRRKDFEDAVAFAAGGEPPTSKEIAEYLGVTEGTVRNHMKEFGYAKRAESADRWVVVKEGANDEND